MAENHLISWLLVGTFVAIGVALVFVRVDREHLRQRAHMSPGYALNRFPLFRYGAALGLWVLAGVVYFTSLA